MPRLTAGPMAGSISGMPSAKSRSITWLHLSDLHACKPRTDWDARRVLDTLRTDLRQMNREHGLRPDLIFFTGDAAYGQIGNQRGELIADQFRDAHDFLTAVRECFDPVVLQRNLFIVPGNHDVNIRQISKFETQGIAAFTSVDEVHDMMHEAADDWAQVIRRLHDYANFLSSYGYDHLLTGRERLTYADVREVAGLRVGIAGFNSAWSSCGIGREEAGRLWMGGRYQLETLLRELPPSDFKIALLHHPGNWLVKEEDPAFSRALERDFQFVLHGHEHQEFVRTDAMTGHSVLSAGACHEWSQSKNNGYNFVRIDLDAMTGEVWLRTYDAQGGGWGPRFVKDRTNDSGRWPLERIEVWLRELIERRAPDSKPEPSDDPGISHAGSRTPEEDYEERYRKAIVDRLDYVHLFGIESARETREYSLSVAYVSLNLADEDAEEDEKIEVSDEEFEFNHDSPPSDNTASSTLPAEAFFDKLSGGSRRLLIRGVAGSGKTTLLRWAAVQAGKAPAEAQEEDWRSRVPFIIRLRDYPNGTLPRPNDYPLIIAKELPDPPAGWVHDLLDRGRALLMFDGVDEVPAARRDDVIREIRNMMNTYVNNLYVLTTRPEAVELAELRELGFVSARVEPLATRDRSEFIVRWHEAMERRLNLWNKAEDLRPTATRLQSQLQDSPAIARLATNPLLCAAICALHYRRHEKLPETPVDLCEKLCEMLIVNRDREQCIDAVAEELRNLDYAKRKGLLCRLAYHMVIAGVSTVTEMEACAHIAAGLHAYGEPDDRAHEVYRALLERSGILQEASDRGVEFIHNTLKEYLAATVFVNKGEHIILAQHAREDSWRPVILFAVAFPRDGSDFATRLIRSLLDELPAAPTRGNKRRAIAYMHSLGFFVYRCCVAAHQIDDPTIRDTYRTLSEQLVPPRSMRDAEALAACGEAVVPYLAKQAHWGAWQRAASVRALGLIGGARARRCLETFADEPAKVVVKEILQLPWQLAPTLTANRFTTLDLHATKAANVSALMNLTNLTRLNLRGAQVADLSPLAGLTNLTMLVLAGAPVSDVSFLRRLTKLTALDLNATQVLDLAPLASLTNLATLHLGRTQVSDLSALVGLTNLTSLYLGGAQVSDLSPLAGFTHLTELFLSATQVSDVSTLSGLAYLTELSLSATQVSDLSPLAGLTNLTRLHLERSQVSDLSPLAGLTNLSELYLSETQVSDLSPLAGLTNLKRLHLERSQVSDLSPLAGLTNLIALHLARTQITDLFPLASLINLTGLFMEGTQVSDLSPLASLTNLTRLNLEGTRVSDLSPLVSLTNLLRLNLEGTRVSDLSPLASLTRLTQLHLQGTRVSDVSALSSLKLDRLYVHPLPGLGDLNVHGLYIVTAR